MAKFWCWFFGHKWHMPNEWFFKNSNVTYVYYCARCGKTAGEFERN